MIDIRSGRNIRRVIGLIGFAMLMTACAAPRISSPPARPTPQHPKPYRVYGTWYQPIVNARGFEQSGVASWYGKDFHGRKTSNGEVYNMYAMTAAHKTLPLGTFVRVHNLANGKSVDVRVNDRGPFVRGRIIDLSYSAAKKMGMVGPGTAPVKVVALGAPEPKSGGSGNPKYLPIDYYSGNFTFQVGAFAERANAERLLAKLDQRYQNAHMEAYFNGRQTFYRVRVGRRSNLHDALAYEKRLIKDGYAQAFIVAE
ncbi:MAG: septal ring lytic transglycosylase RlpA family protein [Desulfobacteraceae bacterium]|jgi:rare lipoprotein A